MSRPAPPTARSSYVEFVSVTSLSQPSVDRSSSAWSRSLPKPPQSVSLPLPPTTQSLPRSPKSTSSPSQWTDVDAVQLPWLSAAEHPVTSGPFVWSKLTKYWLCVGAAPLFQTVPSALKRIVRRG